MNSRFYIVVVTLFIIVFLASEALCQISGNRYLLTVHSEKAETLNQPLPELLIFDPQKRCVLRKLGFDGPAKFNDMMDQLLSTATNSNLAKDNTYSDQQEKTVRKYIHYDENLSDEEKSRLVEQDASKLSALIGDYSCEYSYDENISSLMERSGSKFDETKIVNSLYTIVEYTADWCGPCRLQEKAIETYIENNGLEANWLLVERDFIKQKFKR